MSAALVRPERAAVCCSVIKFKNSTGITFVRHITITKWGPAHTGLILSPHKLHFNRIQSKTFFFLDGCFCSFLNEPKLLIQLHLFNKLSWGLICSISFWKEKTQSVIIDWAHSRRPSCFSNRKSSRFMLMLQMFNVCFPVMILINGETLSEEPAQPVSD